MRVTLNAEQSLYVIDVGYGYTCLGFAVCQSWTRDIARELGRRDLEPTAFASLEAYREYERAVEEARDVHVRTGYRLRCHLTPQLTGLEHRRVEVIDSHEERREFVVGRSTGFIPIHLELSSERAHCGEPVTGAPFSSVRLIDRSRRPRPQRGLSAGAQA
jgi:hypothetical protein